eukprot:8053171-Karenia_brevis.AAC.1
MGGQPQPNNQQEGGPRQENPGGDNASASAGPTGIVRALQGVGPPPRATAAIPYNQIESDNVVQRFLGTLPQGSPQGLGSPMVETLAQASLFAMQHQMEWLPALDMQASDEETFKAMSSTSTGRMVQKEFDIIRMAHLPGAATEFQNQKV